MDIREIALAVQEVTGINFNQMQNPTRYREIVFARQLHMALARKYTRLSRRQIGEPFARDAATVYHAERTISNLCEVDKEIAALYRMANKICWNASQPEADLKRFCNNCVQF
jgi:chromosomal replication initiation ATPase DnaA